MANARSGNTWYIDTTGALSAATSNKKTIVKYIILTPTAASGQIILRNDTSTPTNMLDLRAATSGESKIVDMSEAPMVFSEGINVGTLSNAIATLVVEGGGS